MDKEKKEMDGVGYGKEKKNVQDEGIFPQHNLKKRRHSQLFNFIYILSIFH